MSGYLDSLTLGCRRRRWLVPHSSHLRRLGMRGPDSPYRSHSRRPDFLPGIDSAGCRTRLGHKDCSEHYRGPCIHYLNNIVRRCSLHRHCIDRFLHSHPHRCNSEVQDIVDPRCIQVGCICQRRNCDPRHRGFHHRKDLRTDSPNNIDLRDSQHRFRTRVPLDKRRLNCRFECQRRACSRRIELLVLGCRRCPGQ